MKTLTLTGGTVLLDDEDYEIVMLMSGWYITEGYVQRNSRKTLGKESPAIRLHRFIGQRMGLSGNISFRDGNKLNLCRSNLIPFVNRGGGRKPKQKHPYITKHEDWYYVGIYWNGEHVYLGRVDTEEEALAAQEKYRIENPISKTPLQ